MAERTGRVLELVVFRLGEGATRDQLLGTSEAVSSWAAGQPGFVSRELAYDAEGDRWIDVVWWETMEAAKAAAEVAMTSEACAPMFALIDMDSTQMTHAELAAHKLGSDAGAA